MRVRSCLAVGLGMRHEAAGVNVMLWRVAAGRHFESWRLDGNVLFEKPFSTGRDAVDLITSMGVARRVLPAVPHLRLLTAPPEPLAGRPALG